MLYYAVIQEEILKKWKQNELHYEIECQSSYLCTLIIFKQIFFWKSTTNDTTNHYVPNNPTEHKLATFLININFLYHNVTLQAELNDTINIAEADVSKRTMLWLDEKVKQQQLRMKPEILEPPLQQRKTRGFSLLTVHTTGRSQRQK